MARVLAIEPFHGGSHKAFLDGLVARSRHELVVLGQPARFWKWRMRGSAMVMAERARSLGHRPDVVLASDMLSLAEFLGIYGRVPSILYMHESQVAYPSRTDEERDVHFAMTNLSSCLAADRVVWNSRYHMDSFLEGIRAIVGRMPDERPQVETRSVVIPPGIECEALDAIPAAREEPPIVVWNHRWEHDKRPGDFFEAAGRVADTGRSFRVAVLGESFEEKPSAFEEGRRRLGDRIVRLGYVEDVADYRRWLRRSSIGISTAVQETFGIAAVEAAYAGARPLWPDRLSYPELLPGRDHLYSSVDDLARKISDLLDRPEDPARSEEIRRSLGRFGWSRIIGEYDALIEEVASGQTIR